MSGQGLRDTSVAAYHEVTRTRRDRTQREIVLDAIARHPKGLTRSQIADLTGISLQAVCGRVNELIKARCANELPRTTCPITHKPAHPVVLALTTTETP